MKKIKHIFLSILLTTLFSTVSANHYLGSELYYRWVSGSTYEITLSYYLNCSGFIPSVPNTLSINVRAASINYYNVVNCVLQANSGSLISNAFNCISSTYCVQEFIYRGTWTAPPYQTYDFIFSHTLCCLPTFTQNVTQGNFYVECGLNNFDFPDLANRNNSPFWHNSKPIHSGHLTDTLINPNHTSLCEGTPVLLNESVREYDNDLVKYEMINPRSSQYVNLPFVNGWSFANPMPSSSGPVTIDSLSGILSFTPGSPTGSGVYMVSIKASEYRYDTISVGPPLQVELKQIGFSTRNLFVYIEDSATCTGSPVYFAGPTGLSADRVFLDCPSDSFDVHFTSDFQCFSLDTNGSCLQLRHSATNTIIPITKAKSFNCDNANTSDRIRIFVDTILSPDTFELVLKQGDDLNTLISECFFESTAFEDTLEIIFTGPQTGEMLGDRLGPGNHSTLIDLDCQDTTFLVYLSKKVYCSSVAADGSDFILYNISNQDSVKVKSAALVCTKGTTSLIRLNTDPIHKGNYWLKLKEGNDNNTLEDICRAQWSEDSILVHSSRLFPDLGPDVVYCEENTNFLHFLNPGNYHSYKWSDGSTYPTMLISTHGTYWVNVYNENGCKGTDTIKVTTKKCITGLNEEENLSFNIYPVPASDKIYIHSEVSIDLANIKMFDLSGTFMPVSAIHSDLNQLSIDISELAEGVYILEIQSESGIFRRKVIKNGS